MAIKRGRKSAAELSVVVGGFGARPEPFAHLTDGQAAIWREVTSSEAASFFNTAALLSLLGDYCRHREAADDLSATIDGFDKAFLINVEHAKHLKILLDMRDKETQAAARTATKLRLTNQSRYTPQAAATASRSASASAPWDYK